MISSTYFQSSFSQKLFRIIVGFICILLLFSLGRTLFVSYQTQQNITEQAKRVEILENEVRLLEKEAQEATSSFTLEQRVRDDLKMQKPGEKMYRIQE
jgi:cell division protein FtsB